MFKYFFITVIFTLCLAGLWWKYMPNHNDDPSSSTHASNQIPDSFMDQITYYEFNQNGKLQKMITSNHAIHYEKNNRIDYKNPYITVYSKDGGNWKIKSDKGTSLDGTKIIELIDHVQVHRDASNKNSETTATTSLLKAYPKKNLLQTDRPVKIKQPHLLITGVGMKGDLKTGELRTLTQTKTIYSPKA